MRKQVSLIFLVALALSCHSGKSVRTTATDAPAPVMADRPSEVVLAESAIPAKAPEVAPNAGVKFIHSPMLNETEYKGKLAFATECARCHDLPVLAEYPKKAWARLLPDMQRRGKTDQATMDLISAYVYANYEK